MAEQDPTISSTEGIINEVIYISSDSEADEADVEVFQQPQISAQNTAYNIRSKYIKLYHNLNYFSSFFGLNYVTDRMPYAEMYKAKQQQQ